MIVGIGTDLLAQNRIERALQRFPERFVGRILTSKSSSDTNRLLPQEQSVI